jgi:hypothetical protein
MHLEYQLRKYLNGGDCWGTHPDGSRRLLRISELPAVLRNEVLPKSFCILRKPPLLDPAMLAAEPGLEHGVRGAAFLAKDGMDYARACLGQPEDSRPASDRFSSVAVDVGHGDLHYAQLQLLFKVFDHDGDQHDLALVRWYAAVRPPAAQVRRRHVPPLAGRDRDRHDALAYAARLDMELFEWASRGDGYAVVSIATLAEVAYMTPSFQYDGFFYRNTIMTILQSSHG